MEVSVRARPGTATAAPSSTHAAGCSRVNVDQRVDLHPRPAKGRIAAKNGSIAKAGGVELSTRHHAEILETLRQLISTPEIAIDAIM